MSPPPQTILQLVDCLEIGGTERQLLELVGRLDRRRFRPLVACFKARGELLPALRALGVEPLELPLEGALLQPNTLRQLHRLRTFIRAEGVQLLHAHDFYSNLVGIAAARLSGVPVIASRRDLGHWLSPAKRRALQLGLRGADCILANAEAVARRVVLVDKLPRDRLHVVPNGLDLAAFDRARARPPSPPLPLRPDGVPRIAMVASMFLPDKGHGDLLEAASRLERRGVRAQYLFVSDGELRARYEEEAKSRGLSAHFLGKRDDVPALLGAVDLAVHPSWSEGFPNAVLEAMGAGLPIVATAVGGIPEVAPHREAALLVPPRAPEALARAMESLLADPIRAQALGQAARQRVEQLYTLDRMTERVEQLYDQLLEAVDAPLPFRAMPSSRSPRTAFGHLVGGRGG
jgi:glycosyltransferase involved in cell wall biosynthesis